MPSSPPPPPTAPTPPPPLVHPADSQRPPGLKTPLSPRSGTTSPVQAAATLSPPHSPRLLAALNSAAAATGGGAGPAGVAAVAAAAAAAGNVSPGSSNNSSGSGRGRRLTAGSSSSSSARRAGNVTPGGSVQTRRSVMSLGLGAEYANMNDLTAHHHEHAGSLSPASSAPGSRERSPSLALARKASEDKSPTVQHATAPAGSAASRRASVQFAEPAPPGATNASARRPSMTHLASFLAGVQHHTRVRSPGPSGGRGFSRSASRSASRASSVRRYGPGGGTGRRRSASGESMGSANGAGHSDSNDDDEDFERDGFDEAGDGDERGWHRGGQGPGSAGAFYYDDDQPEPKEFNWFSSVTHPSAPGADGHNYGPASAWFRSPSLQQRRAPSTSSRASSIRSRRSSRRNSAASPPTPGTGPSSPHPALHELVRENTTGGVVPAEAAATPGGVDQWEATYETYKPSVLTTPKLRRATSPSAATDDGDHDRGEDEFLESEPNSPTRSPARLVRTKTYDSYVSSRAPSSSALDDDGLPLNDLANVDVFDEGERVGVGVWLEGRGGYVRDCFAGRADREGKAPGNGLDGPKQLEVERRLGEGTYAIVYLVREVLHDPDPTLDDGGDDDPLSPIDPLASFEFDEDGSRPRLHSWASDTWNPPPKPTYGQYFALKCLCKKNLTEDLIEVQRNEAFLHRALPKHDNIVQMYGAYETDDWLFLVLEYAGGRDAFYWLLEAQEHGTEDLYSRAASPAGDFDGDPDDSALSRTITADTPAHLLVDETPPSPSLLSAAMGDQLLSRKRLRLISRMFGQMCAAVQACHDVGISHRDIKPENFIVIDGKDDRGAKTEASIATSNPRHGVVVKITDWGLGTMQEYCDDFDCGSKPYMAYECRNNLRPSYDPRQADVWSLGLVFLNLLYHRNPWADPSLDDPDFAEYVDDPIDFMQNRFEGMSDEVAHYLANNVFCDVLEIVDGKQRRRVSAGEFGRWASRLVTMMGEGQVGPGERPQITSSDSYSAFEFSPVTTMPVTIAGGGPPGASLLSQFAPSTVKAHPSVFDDMPADLRANLPTVPEVPDMSFTSSTPLRPSYISSPTALSEDGESLPSPTFPSPAMLPNRVASSQHASPNGIARPLPWSTPSPPPPPQQPPSLSPSGTAPASPRATPAAGISLLAARRPTLQDAHADSHMSAGSTVMAPSGPASPSEQPSSATTSPASGPDSKAGDAVSPQPADIPPLDEVSEDAGEASQKDKEEGEDGGKTSCEKEKAGKSKRRKRGARKEKRAARQAEREGGVGSGSGAASPVASPRSGKLPTVDEARVHDHVLDDLAAASQELARELSSTRSGSSSRPRPVPSSRALGTQSTSAIPTPAHDTPKAGPGKRGGGVFGRLKTLVNEGNSDLEAFKRRVDERNTAIGAKADTYSAPAQMQGGRNPRGKYESPFSSHGSIGTASWGSGQDGDDEARGRTQGHWSSASSRRDRLADRRGQRPGAAGPVNDFSPSGSSSTRGNPSSTFESAASRVNTPLSSFGSVGAPSSSATARDWRTPMPSVVHNGGQAQSVSRGRKEAGNPAEAAPARPKLRDASTDTSDLVRKPSAEQPPRAVSASGLAPSQPAAMLASKPSPSPSAPASRPSAACPSAPSPTPQAPSTATTPPPVAPLAAGPVKTNKLSKMFGSISVFNRAQTGAGSGGGA